MCTFELFLINVKGTIGDYLYISKSYSTLEITEYTFDEHSIYHGHNKHYDHLWEATFNSYGYTKIHCLIR